MEAQQRELTPLELRAKSIIDSGKYTSYADLGRQLGTSRDYARQLHRRLTNPSPPARRKRGNPKGAEALLQARPPLSEEPERHNTSVLLTGDQKAALDALPGTMGERLRCGVELLKAISIAYGPFDSPDQMKRVVKELSIKLQEQAIA